MVARTLATPRLCPSMRGNPRCCAQRPLPSMIIATCRGNRAGSKPASARRWSVSEVGTETLITDSQRREDAPLASRMEGLRSLFAQPLRERLDIACLASANIQPFVFLDGPELLRCG